MDSNNIGEIVNGVEDNSGGYRRVEKCWIDRIFIGAEELSTLNTNIPPIAVKRRVYQRVQRQNKIGEVREFWRFKNIADIVHLPVPCLLRCHMIDYDKETEAITKTRSSETFYFKVIRFNQVFQEICKTILLIIQNDV